MSLSTLANTQDIKPEHESMVVYPPKATGIFRTFSPVNPDFPYDDDPPNVAIGRLPPRGTFNGSRLKKPCNYSVCFAMFFVFSLPRLCLKGSYSDA